MLVVLSADLIEELMIKRPRNQAATLLDYWNGECFTNNVKPVDGQIRAILDTEEETRKKEGLRINAWWAFTITYEEAEPGDDDTDWDPFALYEPLLDGLPLSLLKLYENPTGLPWVHTLPI